MSMGGRTAWYCPSCGRPLSSGGACGTCGSSSVPQGVIIEESGKGGLTGLIKGLLGKLAGRTS